jgi:hypothetical protein
MEIEQMKAILELMRENNVQGFEVGDFKVSFWGPHNPAVTGTTPEGVRIPTEQMIDEELGIDDEEF